MKRKILYLFLTLVLVLSACLLTALPVSAAETATLTAPTRTQDVETTFSVNITIAQTGDLKGLNAFLFDIKVTADNLTLNSATAGSLISGWNVSKSAKQTSVGFDYWRIEGDAGTTANVTGDGTLVVLNFTALPAFTDGESTALDLLNCSLSDSGANPITPTLNDGQVTVDMLEVTAATVVGSNTATSEGYVSASDEATTFTMTPTVTGGSATGYTYAWNFGAGVATGTTTASTPNNVTYGSAGAKSITLTVTDSDGSTSTFTVGSIPATLYADLVANFSGTTGTTGHLQEGIVKPSGADFVSTTNYPSTVTFTASSTGGKTAYLYTGLAGWDLDNDGVFNSHDTSPAFDYSANATTDFTGTVGKVTYTVKLTVKDSLLPAYDDETKSDNITIWRAGNVNMDTAIGAADLTKMRLVLVLTDSETFTSDVNDDGVVDARDISKLLIYLS